MSINIQTGIENIAEYNAGGISHIWLLNISDFISYQFEDDSLYDKAFVNMIFKENRFLEVGIVDECNFSETYSSGIYKQELSSYIRTINKSTISWIQQAQNGRFLVVFRTVLNTYFSFGSDGGAKLTYSEQSGQAGGINGMQLKIEKSSVLPLFEVHPDVVKTRVLGSEHSQYLVTEKNDKTNILIEIP